MKRKNKKKKISFKIIIIIILICSFNFQNTTRKKSNNFVSKNTETEELSNMNDIEVSDDITQYSDVSIGTQQINFGATSAENELVEPHIDEETGVKYITYEDFGAYADGEHDDYIPIRTAHNVANQKGYEVRAEKKEYHIFKENDIDPIAIKTNTNWNGATFIIHDENIKDLNTRNYAIFQIMSENSKIIIEDREILDEIEVNKDTKQIKQLSGNGNCLCVISNDKKMQYIRYGNNQNTGRQQQDIFKIDNEGNVLNEIQWDFEYVSQIVLIPIPEEQLIVQNGNFKTILPSDDYEQSTGYFNRNIICYRSNCKIKNINHELNDEEALGGPYYGFLKLEWASDIKVENCQLVSHKYKNVSNYDLIIEYCANIELDNVISDDINDTNRWGITGTNYTKDITYKNCKLNRIDAHCGVHNLNILDSEIGIHGITVVGSGNLNISNTILNDYNGAVYLRDDYGSTWNGEINIKDCTLTNAKVPRIIYFSISYDEEGLHDYGYQLYLPDVNIDGLIIRDEGVNNRYNNIYVFDNCKEKTGIDNGDIRNNYTLPKKITIKNYQTSSGKKLKIFYNKFYDNLEELGINLSMPISDKEEVQITNEKGDNVEDNTITNENIKISYQEVEGIETTVNVNNEKINENKKNLDTDGIYNISITYKNTEGETEIVSKQVTIDKTAPVITGIEQGKTYKNKVIPKVNDENLQKVELLLNGQLVEGYKINSEITDEGIYELIATDKAGNIKNINFQIIEPAENDYKIENDKIINISYNTEKKDFDEKLAIGEKYIIKRGNKTLTENEKIATGDILETTEGKEYKLIVTGDINSDGDVNIKDIIKLRKYLLLRNNLNETEILAADTNLDGKDISIKDLVRMRIIVLTKE